MSYTAAANASSARLVSCDIRDLVSRGLAVLPADAVEEGDRLVFRVERDHAVLAGTPDLLALAGSVIVPGAKRGTPWDEALRDTRGPRAAARR